jgi:hypothetical protein
VDVFRLLNYTELAIAAGQYLGINLEDSDDIDITDYLAMAEKETALTTCACEMGALTASATDAQRESLRSFGHHLGLAHYMCNNVPHDWNDAKILEQKMQAIAALERADLGGPAAQALGALALMPFDGESSFCSARDIKVAPFLSRWFIVWCIELNRPVVNGRRIHTDDL